MNNKDFLNIERCGTLIFENEKYELSSEQESRIEKSYEFLKEISHAHVIYGINTGFGPMAQYRISKDDLNQLQYNLIRSHSNGSGVKLSDSNVKALMIARLNTLALGKSGVSPDLIQQLLRYINLDIHPVIFEHGGVGASGDLVQLAHLGLALIGEGDCTYKGEERPTTEVLAELNIAPHKLQLRDGLAIINGTSCMSGIGVINLLNSKKLIDFAVRASVFINELVESFDDSFSVTLNQVKLHPGQNEIARQMRELSDDSKLLRKRDQHEFDDKVQSNGEHFDKKVQEYYSLRCVPQILGPIWESINNASDVVEREINSASDNPIVDGELEEVAHGGNFHGDYISFEMDKLKIGITKLSMLMERQLNYLMNNKLNERFPPFLNGGTLGLNYSIQGMQFTATSTTAENQTLSNPMYVHSIPCNNDNQDVVSMGTNSALLTKRIIQNSWEVMSIHLLALAHAVDLIGAYDNLSSESKKLYDFIRSYAPDMTSDTPQYGNIANLCKALKKSKHTSKPVV